MKKIVLIRHGESVWNKENRFTGWFDCDLSDEGCKQAIQGGRWLKDAGFEFDVAYTSVLKRAIKTLDIALNQLDQTWLPVIKDWRLNERHYGGLTGLDKAEMAKKFGEDRVKIWRRSYAAINNDRRYANVPKSKMPKTESLKLVVERVIPFWEKVIVPQLKKDQRIIIAAHGNSLRAIIKFIENISEKDIVELNLPTGVPIVIELDEHLQFVKRYYVGDQKTIDALIEGVKNQGKVK
jgi:2,3-bisphosphoglycerate-dependent phosphoglycerate mutase